MSDAKRPQSCWIVTDGAAGNENQCLAVARYLDLAPQVHRIELRQPWESVAPYFRSGLLRAIKEPLSSHLRGPLPDLLLAAGRRSTLASLAARRLSGGKTFVVQILDPKIAPSHFDLVCCPAHDALDGPNVIATRGALHQVDADYLAIARDKWADKLAALPSPRLGVLVGGSSRHFELDEEYLSQLVTAFRAQHQVESVMVTASRRTPDSSVQFLRKLFDDCPGFVWAGPEDGDNPYAGILAWADALLVTADSINMLSEACGTDLPVYTVPPAGADKLVRFLTPLMQSGRVGRPEQTLQPGDLTPLREGKQVAERILSSFAESRASQL